MEFFYDGQIRRYITQTIRVFSNFVVKYGDGTLARIPVMYGDADRQAANIIRNNSENKVNSVPRISIYVSALALDRDRLADASFVGKINVTERGTQIDNVQGSPTYGQLIYNESQGRKYTVERLMPTPFKLTLKVDIWSSSTEQKLQIMEQLLVLFNPSLELQTTDNYVDWTSLTVLNLNDVSWDSRQVPQGVDSAISVATITVDTPIYISPPAKIKHLGVITKIVTSLFQQPATTATYIEGLSGETVTSTPDPATVLDIGITTAGQYGLEVFGTTVSMLHPHESVAPAEPTLDSVKIRYQTPINWNEFFLTSGGTYTAGSSMIYLQQPNGSFVAGTFAINPLDDTKLSVNWISDSLTSNYLINSAGVIYERDISTDHSLYNAGPNYRPNSSGTFDAIINPLTYNPGIVAAGTRYLLVEDIGNINNDVPASEWGSLVAHANDIIEWTGTEWHVVFAHTQFPDYMVWQTNIYTGVQYLWNGVSWVKSFEGEYSAGQWKIVL